MEKQIIAITFPDAQRGWIEDELEIEDDALPKLMLSKELISNAEQA